MIVEQAPEPATVAPTAPIDELDAALDATPGTKPHAGAETSGAPASLPVVPWVLSGKTAGALRAQADRLLAHVRAAVDASGPCGLADVGYSLVSGRATLGHRAVVVGADREELLAGLAALSQGGPGGAVGRGARPGKLGVLFTGQGAQRLGMGRELYEGFPVFAEAFDAVSAEIDPLLGESLREVMWGRTHDQGQTDEHDRETADERDEERGVEQDVERDVERLNGTRFAQPALFAFEVAVFRLLQAWGVRPDVLVGHSIGELAAAHVAGVFSLADAARLVVARGRLMQELPSGGVMVAIQATEQEITPWLSDGVSLAAVNGPQAVVVSGVASAVAEVRAEFEALGRRVSRLAVSHAFHSALMEPMLGDFASVAGQVTYQEPQIPIVSTVTGQVADLTDPAYWVEQVRRPVRFADAVSTVKADGVTRLVEVGPDAVLTGMAAQCLESSQAVAGQGTQGADRVVLVAAQRRNRPQAHTLVSALGQLHTAGADVDWRAFFAGTAAQRVDLPTYAFQREHYWAEAAKPTGDASAVGQLALDHPLLAAVVPAPDSDAVTFTARVSLDGNPWIADHVVHGNVLLPGTGFVELAVHAGDHLGCGMLDELTLHAPLVLPEQSGVALQVMVDDPDERGRRAVRIYSRPEQRPDAPWTRHAEGVLSAGTPELPADLTAWPPAGSTELDAEPLYDTLDDRGFGYGPVFQGLTRAWRRGPDLFAEVTLPEVAHPQAARFGLHPALLDATMHTLGFGGLGAEEDRRQALLPFSWTGVTLHAGGATALRVRLSPAEGQRNAVRIDLADATGAPVATVAALVLRPLSPEQLGGDGHGESLLAIDWQPIAQSAAPAAPWTIAGPGLAVPATGPGLAVPAAEAVADLYALTAPGAGLPGTVVLPIASPGPAASRETVEAAEPAGPVAVVTPVAELVTPVAGQAAASGPGGVPGGVRAALHQALAAMQTFLADDRFAGSRLVLVTRGALAASPGEAVDVRQAPVWGLVRAAQAENPGRFVLLDVDDEIQSPEVMTTALVSGEPELAIRAGTVLAPRLARVAVPASPDAPVTPPAEGSAPVAEGAVPMVGVPAPPAEGSAPVADGFRHAAGLSGAGAMWDPDGTVLVTGGTGGLGAIVARHLVVAHGVRHLVLTSRSGPAAAGAEELRGSLAELGAQARVVACDVSDRDALERLLADIDPGRPLRGVVHAAGVAHNGLVAALSPAQVDEVLPAKADAAWHLHELTAGLDLTAFVLFSSAGGLVMAAGQGNYAAANVFLDALAQHRHALGLPATSLAYGLWDVRTGLSQWLGEADLQRMRRAGTPPLPEAEALWLFDAALASGSASLVPLRVDAAALRAREDEVPALLRGLVPAARRRSRTGPAEAGSLRTRLAGLGAAEREREVLAAVLAITAEVLGHADAGAVDADAGFLESGFDSLTAVELRNRLNAATGLNLPAMVVFDSKSPTDLAGQVLDQLGAAPGAAAAAVPAQRADSRGDTLYELFLDAIQSGNLQPGLAMLRSVAALRPSFDSVATVDRLPEAVTFGTARVGDGPAPLRLICLSTPTVAGGVHQHARLAARLSARVSALPTPGFGRGESLPATLDAAVEVFAETVLRVAGGEPFALLGFSSGGLLAHATAACLERAHGVRPAGLVLVDTYRVGDDANTAIFDQMAHAVPDKAATLGAFGSAELSAMGRYVELLGQFEQRAIAAPLLFVRAGELFQLGSAPAPEGDWQARWEGADTVVTVPGTHFSVVEADVDTTAEVVDGWLAKLPTS
ncbi:type I polyketide synthase [Sphaerisporangium sp. TRM90804]|nr:type I polyketide synthase [Sphaerisporangium sp. TRM90804]